MARIVCKISCVAILNLLYTSMFSDGITLIPYEDNPIVGRPFKLECNTETTIVATVNIKSPDDTPIGSCVPASPPFSATCSNAADYEANLNESLHTLRINTSSMASDVNGTWVCLHDGKRATYALASPLTEIKEERLHLTPFTNNITTTSVSLTATYECINIPVYFKWFVEDESSQEKTELEFANTVIEKNSSLCMNHSGFDAYTETSSSSSVPNRNGRYRIGVEVHYSGEVTALQSIQYFHTYFFSPGGTNTSTDKERLVIGLAIGGVVLVLVLVLVVCMLKKKKFFNNDQKDPDPRDYKDQKDPDPRDYKDQKDPDPRDYKDVTEKFILQREKSQKKSTCNKRQQPDGHEGPQSTTKDPDARYPTTGRPLPRRPDIASPLTGPFDSVNSPRPIVLAPIENPNIPPSIDTMDEQKTDKKPNDKKKKKKKKKKKMKDEEQDNPAYVQDN